MTTAIKIENVSKLYRLGTVGTGTIAHDLNRWWHRVRGKEDPYEKVGQVNDRTKAAASVEKRETSNDSSATSPLATRHSSLSSPSPLVSRHSRLRASGPDYVWALRDINFEVQQGEILGIIGRNGAGKSTLLKLLSRVTAPTTGTIKTRGRIASLLEVGTGFHPDLTGRENIYMNGAILGMKRQEITRQLDEIVDFSGCAKYLDTPVKRYSSGMMVRLGFAVAAHLPCEILIVDEVLAVGDAEFQRKCMGKMRSFSDTQGKTILFVSHNLASVQNLCDTGILLVDGQKVSHGPVEGALAEYLCASQAQAGDGFIPLLGAKRQSWAAPLIRSGRITCREGKNKSVFSLEEDICIEIEFSSIDAHAIHSPVMGVTIRDSIGGYVGGVNTRLTTSNTVESNAYEGTFRCVLKSPPLVQGRYCFDLWFGDGESNLDCVENIFPITLEATDIYQTGRPPLTNLGPMILHPDWTLTSPEH